MSFESLNALLFMQCLLSQFCVLSLSVRAVVLLVFSCLLPCTLTACHLFVLSLQGHSLGWAASACCLHSLCPQGFCVTWMWQQPLLFVHATCALVSGKSLVSCPCVPAAAVCYFCVLPTDSLCVPPPRYLCRLLRVLTWSHAPVYVVLIWVLRGLFTCII